MNDPKKPMIPLPVVSHPASSQAGPTEPIIETPFDKLGGEPTVARLVDRFYHYMDTLPEARTIRAMHDPDLSEIKRVLVSYLVQWTGGPAHYSAERGHPRLRRRHMPFAIGVAERDAWMGCMSRALVDAVPDEQLRAELEAKFFHLADFMRNQPEVSETEP